MFFTKIFFWPKFLWPKNFLTQKFFNQKIFWPQNFFFTQKFFFPKNFFDPIFFWHKQIFDPNKFYDQKYSLTKKFFNQKFFRPKIFSKKNLSTKIFILSKHRKNVWSAKFLIWKKFGQQTFLPIIWSNWVNKAAQQISPPFHISLRYIFVRAFLLLVVKTPT